MFARYFVLLTALVALSHQNLSSDQISLIKSLLDTDERSAEKVCRDHCWGRATADEDDFTTEAPPESTTQLYGCGPYKKCVQCPSGLRMIPKCVEPGVQERLCLAVAPIACASIPYTGE